MAYTKGAVIDWEKLDAPFVRQKISLPTYPFQRKRYWAEAAVPTFGKKLASVHPLLGEKYSTPDNEIIYRCELHLGALPYLKDHQVYGHIIYPGAGYLEMMLAASLNGIGEGEIHLSQVSIEAALSFDAGKVVEIQTVMKPAEGGYKVAVYSQEQEANSENAAWHCHARGTVSINENLNILADFNIDNVRSRCEKIIDHKDFYEAVNSIGIYYGEEFQAVNRLYLGKGEVLAELKIPALTKKYLAHPTLLDGGLQLLAASLWQEKSKDLYLPVGCEAMDFYAPLGDQVLAHWQETEKLEMGRTSNITFYTPLGKILAKITGMHYRKTTEPALKQMLSHESRVDEWLYEWSWEEKFLEEPNIPDPLGHWLVLNDGKVSDTLVNLFESKGASIRQISSADHPKTKEDFIALLKSENFNGILHVTSMGNIIPATSTSIGIAEAQELGCKSFLHLTQALIQLEETLKIPTFLITEGIYSENLAQSPLSGLYKNILLEHPELQMNAIDVSDDFDSPSLFRLIFSSNSESICSLRKSACYVPRFLKLKNIRVEGEEFMPREKIRPEVTYLITGGLGGLGLALTKWLSEHEVTHIVLTGRRALSEEMSKTLNNLKTKSTEITYKALDIADEKSVENLLVSLEQSEKPLKGIFHLAGILDDATLMDQDWNRFENVFRPKVYGSYYLHHYSKDLDFFVMFSSIASTLGSLGQSNYAAANAFMDALCEYRHLKGMPAKSISWGPWAEVGMAKELTSRHAISGLHALKPVEGIRALERALFAKPVHITIANIHWSDFLKQMIKPPLYLEHFEDVKAVRFDLALELKALPEDSRLNLVQKYVADALCTIMRLPPSQEIDKDKGFFDMGLDSLMAVEFKNKLQAGLGSVIRLPSTIVFDYSSIAKMTTYLAEKLVIQVVQKEAVSAKEREEKKILDEIEKLSQEEAIEKLKRELGDD
jgi:acyl transferase domain-containing protein